MNFDGQGFEFLAEPGAGRGPGGGKGEALGAIGVGSEGAGFEGVKQYIRDHRQNDFVDNLCRKLLSYALGRSLMLSDDLTVEQMRAKLAKDGYRFDSLIESVVTSPQFMNKRGPESLASN